MTPARISEIERGLNGVARSVLETVPLAEPWTAKQIHTELYRQGKRIERRVVDSVLTTLYESKIIKRDNGSYIRITAKAPAVVVAKPTGLSIVQTPQQSAALAPAPKDAFDRLTKCVGELRALAGEIEDAMLDAQAEIELARRDFESARKLKELLKAMGD